MRLTLCPPPLFFAERVRLSAFSSRIFACLGFETMQITEPTPDVVLSPPHIDNSTPAGRLARSKLLRAWVELEAWVADYSKRFGKLRVCVVGAGW